VTTLAPILEAYFVERLTQRRASGHTVASYRDTWCLVLRFAQRQTGRAPAALTLGDLDASLIGAFLDHLEHDRGNSVATRNLRLAAIHSLFTFAALRCPELTFLTRAEVDALLASPDRTTFLGRRDHALLLVAVQTGLRVSELTGLTRGDVTVGIGANVHCRGKGRKDRCTPLTTAVARILRDWIHERLGGDPDPLFPTRHGGRLSTDAVTDLVAKHVAVAARSCPSLTKKRVSPHTLRHTAAMNLLHAGVDTSTIALWLGHESTKATQAYLHADMSLKERALARTAPLAAARARFRPSDALLAFLESL